MTVGERGRTAITDARAVLADMVANGLTRVHVVAAGLELFIGRDGEPDPLASTAVATARVSGDPVQAIVLRQVVAPHVGTVEAVATIGSSIEIGDEVARLRVLDGSEAVVSGLAGRVAGVRAEVGELVEYGTPLIEITVRPDAPAVSGAAITSMWADRELQRSGSSRN